MDNQTLLAVTEFSRARLLGSLDGIAKAVADVDAALRYRPGPGRAHFAWQFMHCAATHDKYFKRFIIGTEDFDEAMAATFGGGSTPSDEHAPGIATIRETLARTYQPYVAFIKSATPEQLARKFTMPNGTERSAGESIILLAWHEAHHQGQIHLTWNLYKAAHGIK